MILRRKIVLTIVVIFILIGTTTIYVFAIESGNHSSQSQVKDTTTIHMIEYDHLMEYWTLLFKDLELEKEQALQTVPEMSLSSIINQAGINVSEHQTMQLEKIEQAKEELLERALFHDTYSEKKKEIITEIDEDIAQFLTELINEEN